MTFGVKVREPTNPIKGDFSEAIMGEIGKIEPAWKAQMAYTASERQFGGPIADRY